MASRRNQHCANYIGTLSFPIGFRRRPSNTIALACECEKIDQGERLTCVIAR